MTIVQAHRSPPASAVSLGLAVAVALHVALLTGWQRDPGHPIQPVFVEDVGIICDCIFPVDIAFPLPPEPARPFHKVGPIVVHGVARGWAKIRCDIGADGEVTGCSPVDASADDMSQRAMNVVFKELHGGARRANSEIEFTVRFQP